VASKVAPHCSLSSVLQYAFKLYLLPIYQTTYNRTPYKSIYARSCARSTPELANSPAITNTAQQSPKALVEETWQTVERKYIDRTFNRQDWNAIGQRYLNRSYASYEEAYQAIGEMLRLLNDPSTVFYDPVAFKRLQVQIDNVTGIGLQFIHDRETGAVTIVTPMENTAAQKAGLLPQDIAVSAVMRYNKISF
jgi:carboxyl-terminal processing protease